MIRWCGLRRIAARSGSQFWSGRRLDAVFLIAALGRRNEKRGQVRAPHNNHMSYRSHQRSAGIILALLLILASVASCNRKGPKSQIDPKAYGREIDQWHQERLADLTGETGWLTLIGLYWLKEGQNTFGTGAANDIILPKEKMALRLGTFNVQNGSVTFETPLSNVFFLDGRPVSSIELKTDDEDKPTILTTNPPDLSFQIIKRGEKLGLRVKDKHSAARINFQGLEFYPTDLKWRIEAQFEQYNPPKPMPITNVLGMDTAERSPGAVKFEVDGKEYRLDAVTEKNEPRLFMIIADKTSGKDTYPAGRYLYVDPPDPSGHLVIDFNKAYSPPCAFTKFATCPLPPRQNRLPIAVQAGERYKPHAN